MDGVEEVRLEGEEEEGVERMISTSSSTAEGEEGDGEGDRYRIGQPG